MWMGIIDDQQRHRGEQFHVFFAVAVERGVGQFFQQDVRFAIEHAVSLQDDSMPDGLSKMTFPCARRSFKEAVLAPFHPTGGCQIEDEIAVHLRVELEIQVVQPLVGTAEAGLFLAALQHPLTAAGDFV